MADEPEKKQTTEAEKTERPFWDSGPGTPALPGEPCRTPPHPDWSDNEKWVWSSICVGKSADFNWRYGKKIDPKKDELWTEEEKERRKLSSRFLETILLDERWRSAVPRNGVIIHGAWFGEPVDLDNARIEIDLSLCNCRFEHEVILNDCYTVFPLLLAGSAIVGTLEMDRAEIVGGLLMEGGRFGEVQLGGARIRGHLDMEKAELSGRLFVDHVEIGCDLLMNCGRFAEVRLFGAAIKGQLTMIEAAFSGELKLQRAIVGTEFLMRAAIFEKPVTAIFCEVGSFLDMSGAKFKSGLDLTGTKVDAFLCGSKDEIPELKLNRFTYNHLGGLGWGGPGEQMTDRDAKWFVKWLARQKEYSPQPYEQCAKVLREAGQPGKANAVLYAGRERERESAKNWRQKVWLTLLKKIIGYGLGWRQFFVAGWALGLALLGLLVASAAPEFSQHSWGWWLAFSVDKMIPFVDLSSDHSFKALHGIWRGYFFFIHQLVGSVLIFLCDSRAYRDNREEVLGNRVFRGVV